ncbi:hypothetical protein SAMN05660690_0731 [Geodermatophilus telluris]|uniref:Uncharacterized protein n=1 Tax=Geodermatophilus telluris TaxID=1190417 RepID=A0A1G6JAA8_9ACTN|nr:hypothetical protein [Geodermatophilus telluris]SDC15577.1 hypothetical protein SAMN05660690_0731 [Geodermatophilus telluris]
MTRSRRTAAAAALLAAPLLATGCGGDTSVSDELPACASGDDATAAHGVVLMAQAVPTATWLPCVESVPVGWTFTGLDAHSGAARFWLDSDRDGAHAIEVQLDADCDTTGATEIPSEREGLRRFERVEQVSPRFLGERYYVFPGGCLTVVFRLSGDNRGEPLALATQSLGVVSREDLAAQVHEESGGRLQLDPPAAEGDPS